MSNPEGSVSLSDTFRRLSEDVLASMNDEGISRDEHVENCREFDDFVWKHRDEIERGLRLAVAGDGCG
jgi:hypothetical protein